MQHLKTAGEPAPAGVVGLGLGSVPFRSFFEARSLKVIRYTGNRPNCYAQCSMKFGNVGRPVTAVMLL